MVFAFLVICVQPVSFVNAVDNDTEISCFVGVDNCEVITINIVNPQFEQYAERVDAYDGFANSIVGEARAPDLESSKVYYTTSQKDDIRQRLNLVNSRNPRDGLNQRV